MRTWAEVLWGILNKVRGMFKSNESLKEAMLTQETITRGREVLADAIRMNFLKGVNPFTGDNWKPVLRGGQPLILTGNLMRKAASAAGAATFTTTGILAVMDEPFYGAFHQHGTKNIVPRPFFGIPQETKTELAALLGKAIAANFEGTVQGSEDYQGYLF